MCGPARRPPEDAGGNPQRTVSLAQRCVPVQLLVLDVDGVLTDGSILYADDGVEWKRFHVRDGSGLALWRLSGRRAAIISGRTSRAVEVRAAELGISPVIQASSDKLASFRRLLAETGYRPEQTCCVADDLPDLPLLRNCGLAVAVADACPEAAADAHYVTTAPGGHGAVREVVELILRHQGLWEQTVARYRAGRL